MRLLIPLAFPLELIVTMDLYDSFRNAVKAKLKRVTIIADRFHYTRIVSRAFDELRIQLWRDAKGLNKNI